MPARRSGPPAAETAATESATTLRSHAPSDATFADVILPRHLRRTFTYRIPPHLHDTVRVGAHVQVPFGKIELDAVVVAIGREPGAGLRRAPGDRVPDITKLRAILSVCDGAAGSDIPSDLLILSRMVADYYLAPWGQCVRLILPPATTTAAETAASSRRRRKATPPAPTLPSTPMEPDQLPGWWSDFGAALAQSRPATFILMERAPRQWRIIVDAIDVTLAQGRRALVISPSVSRADELAALARGRHGERVSVLHSGMPAAARAAGWTRIRAGDADVVIGTRSAIFAPLRNIGLIAIEEEDDPNLKEETEPLYHAREVAKFRAQQHQAVLLLASPHPTMETLTVLGPHAMPPSGPSYGAPIQVVDLRSTAFGMLLSDPLIDAMAETLAAHDRVVLYLNRKGFAPALQCRDCGGSPSCSRCHVAYTFYKHRGRLACHYCGASAELPDVCPDCHAAKLEPSGTGTERVEDAVRRLHPSARIERLDRDRAPRPRQADAIRRRFNAGEIDILIGTQMVMQGPSLRSAGLLGLIHAEAGLHLPDFRAGERTYHGLLDAISLVRPDGRVIAQTWLPAHPVIEALAQNRPALLYEPERSFRESLGYPPFAQLISLRVSATHAARAQAAAQQWSERLARVGGNVITIWGPIASSPPTLRGRHRWQLLVKAASADAARAAVRQTLEELEAGPRRGLKYEVDVDPVALA